MKRIVLKVFSAIVAVLPHSAQVMAGISNNDELGKSRLGSQLGLDTSTRLQTNVFYHQLSDGLPYSAEINDAILRDAVFSLNENGQLEVIGSRSEIKKLLNENKKLRREILEAKDVAPTSA